MPLLNPDATNTDGKPVSMGNTNFAYSAVRPSTLGATEYTIAVIEVDTSSSVEPFAADLEATVLAAVESLRDPQQTPRTDSLLLRVARFSTRLHEIHGFQPLPDCHPALYKGKFPCSGQTALYDACLHDTEMVGSYAAQLVAARLTCNGILYTITDGMDVGSVLRNPGKINDAAVRIRQEENLESFLRVLVGVNLSAGTEAYLQRFMAEAGYDEFIALRDATKDTLGRLGKHISAQISSQSISLGTGGPSKVLSF